MIQKSTGLVSKPCTPPVTIHSEKVPLSLALQMHVNYMNIPSPNATPTDKSLAWQKLTALFSNMATSLVPPSKNLHVSPKTTCNTSTQDYQFDWNPNSAGVMNDVNYAVAANCENYYLYSDTMYVESLSSSRTYWCNDQYASDSWGANSWSLSSVGNSHSVNLGGTVENTGYQLLVNTSDGNNNVNCNTVFDTYHVTYVTLPLYES
jgi:hypothetical protein